MLMSIIPDVGYLKLDSFRLMRLLLSAFCRKTSTLSTMGTSALKSSASKGQMQLTSYLWKKIGKLWKNYGIFFLGICTNPVVL